MKETASKKDKAIHQILDLGIALISQKSYHNLGLKEILDTAGIPKGSFYYYFDSKEDFGIKVIEHYANKSLQYMNRVLKDAHKSPLERLKLMFEDRRNTYLKTQFKDGCLMGDCSNELAGQYSSFQKILDEKFNAWKTPIKNCIEEGQARGEINKSLDPTETADFLLSSWEGALLRMKAAQSIHPFDTFVDFMIHQILKA